MLLHEIVGEAARDAPDAPALVWDGTVTTFAELAARVRRLAGAVAEVSEPGDRVAVLADNHPAWIEAYYGVPMAGRVLVFLNQRQHPAEWSAILARTGARVLIAQDDLAGRLRRDDGLAPVETVLSLVDRDHAPSIRPPPADPDAVAWVIFTSGTTAAPKGAMLTHASLVAAVETTAKARPVDPDAVYCYPFPLCHVAGYNVLLHHRHRRPVVLLPGFSPTAVCEVVPRHGVTTISMAPTMLAALLDHPALAGADLASLRTVSYGASAMPAVALRTAMERLGCGFAQGYGMTELSGNAVFLGVEEHQRAVTDAPELLGSAGRPAPGVEVQILDDGEIAVRAPQVMAGYWEDAEGTAAAFTADGWFRTGDVGRLDADGYLYVIDRKKDVIVSGGENVASREVEDVLHRHPSVTAAAVVGVPDRTWGERVAAFVVGRPGQPVDVAALEAFLRDHLAGYKVPRIWEVVDELPTGSSGKVLKRTLRERLRDQASQPRSSSQ